MSDFDIDPARMAEQAARLRDLHEGPAGLPAIPIPDTGETSAHTAAVLSRLDEVRDELVSGLAGLAANVDQCLATYAQADGEAGWGLELLMRAVLS